MSKLTEHTPLPWEVVPANEHHGPYVTTAFGTTVCDLYAMSDPAVGERRPITFTDGADNADLIIKAVNAYDDLVAVLQDIVVANGLRPGHIAYLSRADITAMALAALAKAGAA